MDASSSSTVLSSVTSTAEAILSTDPVVASPESRSTLSLIAGFLPTALIKLIGLATFSVPLLFYRILTWSFTLHLNFSSLLVILGVMLVAAYLVVRYRYLNKYSRLRSTEPPKSTSSFFDLHPDDSTEEDSEYKPGLKNYPDEFLSAFLSSIKIFGYLEQHVFHELARHLQTKKLLAGDTLFRNPEQERSFYIVVHGHVQLFAKPETDHEDDDENENMYASNLDNDEGVNDRFRHYTLINEVGAGGTLSSLFTILSVFRDSVDREEQKKKSQERQLTAFNRDSSHENLRTVFPNLQSESLEGTFKKHRSGLIYPKAKLSSSPRPSDMESDSRPSRDNSDLDEIEDPDLDTRKISISGRAKLPSLPTIQRQSRSVHPNIVARATVDTTLAVIPEEAFHKLTQKFPKAAAHIVQVILTRFQRVTLMTGHRYLGLTEELLRLEKMVNESASLDTLPQDLFVPGGIERLRKKFAQPSDHHQGEMGNAIGMSLTKSDSTGFLQAMDIPPTPAINSTHNTQSPPRPRILPSSPPKPNHREHNEYSVEDDEHLRTSIMQSLSDCLGLREEKKGEHTPSLASSLSPQSSRHRHRPSGSSSLGPESLKSSSRYYYPMDLFSHAGTVDASASPSLGALSVPYDDDIDAISTVSSVQSGNDYSASGEVFSSNDVQILYFPKDAILVKEGEHNNGLFFVIDGLLDASMTPSNDDEISLEESQSASKEWQSRKRKSSKMKRHASFNLSPSTSTSSVLSSSDEQQQQQQQQQKNTAADEGAPNTVKESASVLQRYGPVYAHKAPVGRTDIKERKKEREEISRKKPLFVIKPGGLAGYLAALTGYPSFVEIRAKTDTYVGYLSKKALDRIIDRHPAVMLKLAQRLVGLVSPLILHIDLALEWMQVNAGQIICREGQPSNSIYMVLHGRLRTIKGKKEGGIEILGEFSHGDTVCELEALAGIPSPSTLHAIRDSELARIPKTLFNALTLQHPEITLQISRMVALRSLQLVTKASPQGGSMIQLRNKTITPADAINNATPELYGYNNANLKTIGILPVNASVPVTEFAENLKSALIQSVGASCILLNSATITSVMGKHAFSRLGKLKLASWLAEQEEKYRIVLYLADSGVKSQWTRTCIRQADSILLVGLGDGDPSVGEYERFMINMKTTARKELVLLHGERSCTTGTTQNWLKNRLWIQAHHHIFMPMRKSTTLTSDRMVRPPWLAAQGRKMTENSINMMKNVKGQLVKYYSAVPQLPQFGRLLVLRKSGSSPLANASASNAARDDFARLARRLCGKSVALVLGGGGARGISHIGVIQALEEAGIPIDIIGGTSIGSFVGGLYAKNRDLVSTIARTKLFSGRITSIWRNLTDLTYPLTAWFTGHEFNRSIYKCLGDSQIEDFWLPYFAVSTNITYSRMEVHTTGYAWRYIRASMTLSGYIPPICENGNMLVDGGYMDNLPVSVAKSMGADIIIAVDVASEDDTSPVNYGDSISGLWALLYNLNPFRSYNIPSIAEIQSRLAYVSSVSKLQEAKMTDGTLYVKLPVQQWGTLEFDKFKDIFQLGYDVGRQVVDGWRKHGYASGRVIKDSDESISRGQEVKGKRGRRNSI